MIELDSGIGQTSLILYLLGYNITINECGSNRNLLITPTGI
jgi:hypothetical protein